MFKVDKGLDRYHSRLTIDTRDRYCFQDYNLPHSIIKLGMVLGTSCVPSGQSAKRKILLPLFPAGSFCYLQSPRSAFQPCPITYLHPFIQISANPPSNEWIKRLSELNDVYIEFWSSFGKNTSAASKHAVTGEVSRGETDLTTI